jgi:hypothetical protein
VRKAPLPTCLNSYESFVIANYSPKNKYTVANYQNWQFPPKNFYFPDILAINCSYKQFGKKIVNLLSLKMLKD